MRSSCLKNSVKFFSMPCSFGYLLSNILRPEEYVWRINTTLTNQRTRAHDGGAGDAVENASELFDPSSGIVLSMVAFFSYPNIITNLRVMLNRSLSLRSTVQNRCVLHKPMFRNCLGARLLSLMIFEIVNANG